MEFRDVDLSWLKHLGFCKSECSTERPPEQLSTPPKAKTSEEAKDLQAAFDNFASLIGDKKIITAWDLVYFFMVPEKSLATLIENDPATKKIKAADGELIIKPNTTHTGNEISKSAQKRLITYLQMALNKIYEDDIKDGKMQKLKVNGVFDDVLADRIQEFQSDSRCDNRTLALRTDRDIAAQMKKKIIAPIGPATLDAIVFHVKTSKEDIAEALETSKLYLSDAFFMTTPQYEHRRLVAQQNLASALMFLGFITSKNGTCKETCVLEAGAALERFFDGAELVGPKILDAAKERVLANGRFSKQASEKPSLKISDSSK